IFARPTTSQGRDDHSAFRFASRMSLPHLADSLRMRSANASGELVMEKMKLGARNFSRKPGSSKILWVCALSLATTLCGRAFGRGQSVPRSGFVAGQAAFGERGHIGILRHPPRAAKAEHLQRAGLPWLRHKPDRSEEHT